MFSAGEILTGEPDIWPLSGIDAALEISEMGGEPTPRARDEMFDGRASFLR